MSCFPSWEIIRSVLSFSVFLEIVNLTLKIEVSIRMKEERRKRGQEGRKEGIESVLGFFFFSIYNCKHLERVYSDKLKVFFFSLLSTWVDIGTPTAEES